MSFRKIAVYKFCVFTSYALLGVLFFFHYQSSIENKLLNVERVTESRLVTRPLEFKVKAYSQDYNNLINNTDKLIYSSIQQILIVTGKYGWGRLNTTAENFLLNKISFKQFVGSTESLVKNFSLKGPGLELLNSEISKLKDFHSLKQTLEQGLQRLNSETKIKPNVISKRITVPSEGNSVARSLLNLFFIGELILVSIIAVFTRKIILGLEAQDLARKSSRLLEAGFALKAGFVSTVFELDGKCITGSQHLNLLLNKLKNDPQENICDWPSVAEIMGLHNTYSLKDLPEGIHRIDVQAKNLNSSNLRFEIVFDLNLKSRRVGILFKETLNEDNNIKSTIEMPEFAKLDVVNVNESLGLVLEELSPFVAAKGVKVNFSGGDDLIVRLNQQDFEQKITSLLKTVIQNCADTNNLKEIKVSTHKNDNFLSISLLLDGKELGAQLLIDSNRGTSIEDEICQFEKSLADFHASVSIKNTYDSKDEFMFSEIGLVLNNVQIS
jgi:hypothetical protein